MPREDAITVEGAIVEVLPNTLARVRIANGHVLLARLPRRAREQGTALVPGQNVRVLVTPFDLSKGVLVV